MGITTGDALSVYYLHIYMIKECRSLSTTQDIYLMWLLSACCTNMPKLTVCLAR